MLSDGFSPLTDIQEDTDTFGRNSYYKPDGSMSEFTGWQLINDKWYYFDNVGYMVHDKWIGDYYLGSDGAMLIGTVTPDGYSVDASGKWISGSPEETIFENFIQNEEYTSEWYVNPTKYGY